MCVHVRTFVCVCVCVCVCMRNACAERCVYMCMCVVKEGEGGEAIMIIVYGQQTNEHRFSGG